MQIGNFIGDFVKGKAYENYPSSIQKGILQHRYIDDFTDHHATVLEAKILLHGAFGHYAGVVLDMYYDHFLATNFTQYNSLSLSRFSRRFYWTMIYHYRNLPKDVRAFIWHFISSNRLCRYASLNGLQQSLEIMVRYKPLKLKAEEAITFLITHYQLFQDNFRTFFPDVIRAVSNYK